MFTEMRGNMNKFRTRTPLVTSALENAYRIAKAEETAIRALERIANTPKPKRGFSGEDALGLILSAKAALRKIEEIKHGRPDQ